MSRPLVMPPDDRGTLDYRPTVEAVKQAAWEMRKGKWEKRLYRLWAIYDQAGAILSPPT